MKPYPNPPVNEVVAEFYFQDSEWDWVIPGMLFEALKGDFPNRRMPHSGTISIPTPPQFKMLGAELVLPNPVLRTDRVFLVSENESELVQIAPNLLVINKVKLYSSWKEFFPLIKRVYAQYKKISPNSRVAKLGLQYVNKLEFPAPAGVFEPEDFLEFRPFTGKGLPKDHGPFSINVQYLMHESAVVAQLGNANYLNPELFGSVLEIKAFTLEGADFSETGIYNWMEQAHTDISSIFEGCLTDRAREVFRR